MSEAKRAPVLTAEQVAEVQSRYEAFGLPDPDCTCTRKDVDFYDTSGCERCDRQSDFNRSYSHAKHMLDVHGAQDIEALRASHEALRESRDDLMNVLNLLTAVSECFCIKHGPAITCYRCHALTALSAAKGGAA